MNSLSIDIYVNAFVGLWRFCEPMVESVGGRATILVLMMVAVNGKNGVEDLYYLS